MTTFLSANETAAKFGIMAEKLDKILNRKDCPKDMVDDRGYFSVEAVAAMLTKMKKAAESAKQWHDNKVANKTVKKSTKRTAKKTVKRAVKKTAKPVPTKKACRRKSTSAIETAPTVGTAPTATVITFSDYKRKFWEFKGRWAKVVDGTMTSQETLNLVKDALEFGYAELIGAPMPGSDLLRILTALRDQGASGALCGCGRTTGLKGDQQC